MPQYKDHGRTNACWTHFEPVPVFSTGLEFPSDSVVLFPVPLLLLLFWLIATEVGLLLTILLSFPWRRQRTPAIPGKSLALHYPVWSEPMGTFEYLNYPWLYQSVSILIFIGELYATASLLNFETLRAVMSDTYYWLLSDNTRTPTNLTRGLWGHGPLYC